MANKGSKISFFQKIKSKFTGKPAEPSVKSEPTITPEKPKKPSLVENVRERFRSIKEKVTKKAAKPEPKKPEQVKKKLNIPKIKKQPQELKEPKTEKKPEQPKEQKVKPKIESPRQEAITPPKPEKAYPAKVIKDISFFAETVIANYRKYIAFFPRSANPILTVWLDRLIEENGIENVATMIQSGAQAGHILTYQIAYDEELLAGYMADMLDYLPDMTDWYKAEIMEQFESWEDLI